MIKFLKLVLLGLTIASVNLQRANAQSPASEYEVKAAFLYNFIKFVEWPPKAFPEKQFPYVIGVLGKEDPFSNPVSLTNYLDEAIIGKKINERPLVIVRRSRIADLKECHLIFISKSERSRLKDILGALRDRNVLTVSETEDFCQQGGVVNFIKQSGKVRFEINPSAAEAAGLKISSKLLNVAKIVATEPR